MKQAQHSRPASRFAVAATTFALAAIVCGPALAKNDVKVFTKDCTITCINGTWSTDPVTKLSVCSSQKVVKTEGCPKRLNLDPGTIFVSARALNLRVPDVSPSDGGVHGGGLTQSPPVRALPRAGWLADGRFVSEGGQPAAKTSCSTGWVEVANSNPKRWTCAGTVSGSGPLQF